jgi:hypothetical protein
MKLQRDIQIQREHFNYEMHQARMIHENMIATRGPIMQQPSNVVMRSPPMTPLSCPVMSLPSPQQMSPPAATEADIPWWSPVNFSTSGNVTYVLFLFRRIIRSFRILTVWTTTTTAPSGRSN